MKQVKAILSKLEFIFQENHSRKIQMFLMDEFLLQIKWRLLRTEKKASLN